MALDISHIQSSNTQAARPEAARQASPEQAAAKAAEQRAAAAEAARASLQAELAKSEPALRAPNMRLAFSVNSKLDEVVVKVIDSDTDKVVREIPAEELQHVYERIREVVGLLFDQSA